VNPSILSTLSRARSSRSAQRSSARVGWQSLRTRDCSSSAGLIATAIWWSVISTMGDQHPGSGRRSSDFIRRPVRRPINRSIAVIERCNALTMLADDSISARRIRRTRIPWSPLLASSILVCLRQLRQPLGEAYVAASGQNPARCMSQMPVTLHRSDRSERRRSEQFTQIASASATRQTGRCLRRRALLRPVYRYSLHRRHQLKTASSPSRTYRVSGRRLVVNGQCTSVTAPPTGPTFSGPRVAAR